MGGIAAVWDRTAMPTTTEMGRMLDSLRHRGDRSETLVFGNTALATVAHGHREDAWMASDQDFAVAFAGTLDNLTELAANLGLGTKPQPSPAKVVLATFRSHAEMTPALLRGIFAVVVTNGESVWVFRDQVGFAPLFVRSDPSRLFIASEAKGVVAGAGIAREPDLEMIGRVFYGNVGNETRCALKGVERLPAATLLSRSHEGVARNQYWNPADLLETANISHDEIHERFEELMDQAVARTLTGQDIVSFSGGYDSPAVAAYAAPHVKARYGKPLAAISLVYPNLPTVDERRFIEPAAREIGLEPLHLFDQIAKPLDDIAEWVSRFDGPVAAVSLAENYEHLQRVRNLGYSTMLSGDLAEFVADERNGILQYLLATGHLRTALRYLGSELRLGVPFPRVVRQVGRTFVPPSVRTWRSRQMGDPNPHRPAWLDRAHMAEPHPFRARTHWREQQLHPFRGPGLSLEADEFIQNYAGVQTRRPWADIDLWEFFLSLPAAQKFPNFGRKYLVRDLLRGRVPDLILDRTTKTVFDDSIIARIDYSALRSLLVDSPHRIGGVDYDLLYRQIDNESLSLVEFMWAKDLAAVHAFLSLW